ncbi:hypothetical protein UFOVP221_91 [uncultured Caudovirales phage]|uniref:Uncharacterized protein n=1 Tax=uncultured Caudovirales phage TaxID=2100421 RepID=A0A6J7WRX1_9CAUD|nr:hypothetical protein UFOVP221_91 [uncultured Caudovirales phage]
MASRYPTKLPPAALPFPNGGGIAAVATRGNKVKEQEIRVAEEQHKLKLAQIEAKHAPKAKK